MAECSNCGKIENNSKVTFCSRCYEMLPQEDIYTEKKESFIRKVVMPVGLLWIITGFAFFFFLKANESPKVERVNKISEKVSDISAEVESKNLSENIEEVVVDNKGNLDISKETTLKNIVDEKEDEISKKVEDEEKIIESEIVLDLDTQIQDIKNKFKDLYIKTKKTSPDNKEIILKIAGYYKKIDSYEKMDLSEEKKQKILDGYTDIYEKLELKIRE